jgi:hypothetical protein
VDSDLATARMLGRRVAAALLRWSSPTVDAEMAKR